MNEWQNHTSAFQMLVVGGGVKIGSRIQKHGIGQQFDRHGELSLAVALAALS